MSILTIISEKIKTFGTAIAGIFSIIATVGGAVLYVENNYANAGDVKTIIRNQSMMINQNLIFQMEYYDDRIRKLETELAKSQEIISDNTIPKSIRAYTRKPDDIKSEIQELKSRRQIITDNFLKNSQNQTTK